MQQYKNIKQTVGQEPCRKRKERKKERKRKKKEKQKKKKKKKREWPSTSIEESWHHDHYRNSHPPHPHHLHHNHHHHQYRHSSTVMPQSSEAVTKSRCPSWALLPCCTGRGTVLCGRTATLKWPELFRQNLDDNCALPPTFFLFFFLSFSFASARTWHAHLLALNSWRSHTAGSSDNFLDRFQKKKVTKYR